MENEGGTQILSAGVWKTIESIKEIVGNHSDADIYVALRETHMDPDETVKKLLNQGSQNEGGTQILSAGIWKTIESIKEIVGNHSDADIYVALRETHMDPDETVQKLLNQDLPITRKKSLQSMESGLKMVCGAFYIAKGRQSKPQGDDAHFICVEKQTFGVADGVGGWSKRGVDAGVYARELMKQCVNVIQDEPKCDVDPFRVLYRAYSNTDVKGSSTACILTLKHNHLHVANVGDSGFVLIREGEVVYKSPIQQRHFNCPYQLGNSSTSDHPCSAQVFKIAVEPGDVIVVGTDGLFDNMFATQIEEVVKMVIDEGGGGGGEPEQVAWAVAEHAYYNSLDATATTPFTDASLNAGKQRFGGKADDITVIAARIL